MLFVGLDEMVVEEHKVEALRENQATIEKSHGIPNAFATRLKLCAQAECGPLLRRPSLRLAPDQRKYHAVEAYPEASVAFAREQR